MWTKMHLYGHWIYGCVSGAFDVHLIFFLSFVTDWGIHEKWIIIMSWNEGFCWKME